MSDPIDLARFLGNGARISSQGRTLDRDQIIAAARGRSLPKWVGGRAVLVDAADPLETTVSMVAVLMAGGAFVPIGAHATQAERAHIHALTAPCATIDARGSVSLENPDQGLPQPELETSSVVLFTSGTTGKPKGVVLPPKSYLATFEVLADAWQIASSDRLAHCLPLHHTHGLLVALGTTLFAGGSVTFVEPRAAALQAALPSANIFMAVPTVYARLQEFHASGSALSMAHLRLATSGSAALPADLFRTFQDHLGQTLLERYGMTEIGMAVSNPYLGERRAGFVGQPLPGVSVDLVNDQGEKVLEGEPGELRVATPQMFARYLTLETRSAEADFDDQGRFRTGDTGVWQDGALRILGRTSTDILKSAGYKLSALEIEDVLRSCPGVAEIAVIGLPDATFGEVVTACVVLAAGKSLTLDDVIAHARQTLSSYKVPRKLVTLSALPRTALGKVQKKELLELVKREKL